MTLILLALLSYYHFFYGVELGLYRRSWFGPWVHVLGGLFLASLTGSLIVSFLIAAAWELFEYGVDNDTLCWYSRSWKGAVRDILFTTLGAAIWIILV